MGRGDRREEIFRDERDDGSLWAISLKARGALQGESAMLCPDGESFSSRRDDARGQPFKADASAEDRVHGLL